MFTPHWPAAGLSTTGCVAVPTQEAVGAGTRGITVMVALWALLLEGSLSVTGPARVALSKRRPLKLGAMVAVTSITTCVPAGSAAIRSMLPVPLPKAQPGVVQVQLTPWS